MSYQSYDAKFLRKYPELAPTPLQLEEDLEQLKVLENGYKMKVLLGHKTLLCILINLISFDKFFFSLLISELLNKASESEYS